MSNNLHVDQSFWLRTIECLCSVVFENQVIIGIDPDLVSNSIDDIKHNISCLNVLQQEADSILPVVLNYHPNYVVHACMLMAKKVCHNLSNLLTCLDVYNESSEKNKATYFMQLHRLQNGDVRSVRACADYFVYDTSFIESQCKKYINSDIKITEFGSIAINTVTDADNIYMNILNDNFFWLSPDDIIKECTQLDKYVSHIYGNYIICPPHLYDLHTKCYRCFLYAQPILNDTLCTHIVESHCYTNNVIEHNQLDSQTDEADGASGDNIGVEFVDCFRPTDATTKQRYNASEQRFWELVETAGNTSNLQELLQRHSRFSIEKVLIMKTIEQFQKKKHSIYASWKDFDRSINNNRDKTNADDDCISLFVGEELHNKQLLLNALYKNFQSQLANLHERHKDEANSASSSSSSSSHQDEGQTVYNHCQLNEPRSRCSVSKSMLNSIANTQFKSYVKNERKNSFAEINSSLDKNVSQLKKHLSTYKLTDNLMLMSFYTRLYAQTRKTFLDTCKSHPSFTMLEAYNNKIFLEKRAHLLSKLQKISIPDKMISSIVEHTIFLFLNPILLYTRRQMQTRLSYIFERWMEYVQMLPDIRQKLYNFLYSTSFPQVSEPDKWYNLFISTKSDTLNNSLARESVFALLYESGLQYMQELCKLVYVYNMTKSPKEAVKLRRADFPGILKCLPKNCVTTMSSSRRLKKEQIDEVFKDTCSLKAGLYVTYSTDVPLIVVSQNKNNGNVCIFGTKDILSALMLA